MKIRCYRDSVDQDCQRCLQSGQVCRSDAPVRRKGPEKGYIQRLHELEALMGVLLALPNLQVRDVVVALGQDGLGGNILTQVANGPFGPRALAGYATAYDAGSTEGTPDGQPTSTSNAYLSYWQLQAVRAIVARNQAQASSSTILSPGVISPDLDDGSSELTVSPSDTSQGGTPYDQMSVSVEGEDYCPTFKTGSY